MKISLMKIAVVLALTGFVAAGCDREYYEHARYERHDRPEHRHHHDRDDFHDHYHQDDDHHYDNDGR